MSSSLAAGPALDYLLLTGADPAAGAEAELEIGGGYAYLPAALYVVLATSGAGGNRFVRLTVTSGADRVFNIPAVTAVGPGVVDADLTWGVGIGSELVNTTTNDHARPLPPIVLLPGMVVSTRTNGIQAGDDYQPLRAWVRRLPLAAPAVAGLDLLEPLAAVAIEG